jgi:hypothetical protein
LSISSLSSTIYTVSLSGSINNIPNILFNMPAFIFDVNRHESVILKFNGFGPRFAFAGEKRNTCSGQAVWERVEETAQRGFKVSPRRNRERVLPEVM